MPGERKVWVRKVFLLHPEGRIPFGYKAGEEPEGGLEGILPLLRWVEEVGQPLAIPLGQELKGMARSLWEIQASMGLPTGMVRYLVRSVPLAEELASLGLRVYLHEKVWVPGYGLWAEGRLPGMEGVGKALFLEYLDAPQVWEMADGGREVLLAPLEGSLEEVVLPW